LVPSSNSTADYLAVSYNMADVSPIRAPERLFQSTERIRAIMKEQQMAHPMAAQQSDNPFYPCVEKGIWTPIPKPPPKGPLRLTLKAIDPDQSKQVKSTNRLTFHAVGCSGRYEKYPDGSQPGPLVAKAIATQATKAGVYGGYASAEPASFLFHLGDVVYKQDTENASAVALEPAGKSQPAMYNTQFYEQYASYKPEIFSIPGNHDRKFSRNSEQSAIDHYLINFCDS
jgi:hypothetical protein